MPFMAALLCCGSISCKAAAQASTASTVPARVSGHVFNGMSEAPISRALVQLGSHAVLTDEQGQFSFDSPEQPVESIRVTKPGFFSGPEQNEGAGSSSDGRVLDPHAVVLDLWPEAILTGRVLGPDGEPLRHISIQAHRGVFDEQGHRMQIAGQSQTDSHGQFRIPVASGDFRVTSQFSPRGPERDKAVMPVTYPPSTEGSMSPLLHVEPGEEQQIELHPQVSRTYVATIPVEGGDEGPPPRIMVRTSSGLTFSPGSLRSGDPGLIRLNVPPGSYTLQATRFSRESVQYGESSLTVPDHDVTGPSLHLAALPSIPVDLVTETSTAAPGSRVPTATPNLMQFNLVLEPSDAEPAPPFQFGIRPTQQREGAVSFAAPVGTYRLSGSSTSGWYIQSATSRGTDLLREGLTVPPSGTPSPITLVASNQTGSLQGTVKLAGASAACWIYLIAAAPALSRVTIRRSDAFGVFHVTDLAPGTYHVLAFPFRHSEDLESSAVLNLYATHVGYGLRHRWKLGYPGAECRYG